MKLDTITAHFDLSHADPYPLDKWNPELSGDIDIVVTKDGKWIHEGEEIKRKPLVKLFASLVKEEAGECFLVTPVEKWRICVEDRPLHVLSVTESDEGISAILSNGRSQKLTEDSGLRLADLDGVGVPVMTTEQGPQARFTRTAYYTLIECGELTDSGLVLYSDGHALNLPLIS